MTPDRAKEIAERYGFPRFPVEGNDLASIVKMTKAVEHLNILYNHIGDLLAALEDCVAILADTQDPLGEAGTVGDNASQLLQSLRIEEPTDPSGWGGMGTRNWWPCGSLSG